MHAARFRHASRMWATCAVPIGAGGGRVIPTDPTMLALIMPRTSMAMDHLDTATDQRGTQAARTVPGGMDTEDDGGGGEQAKPCLRQIDLRRCACAARPALMGERNGEVRNQSSGSEGLLDVSVELTLDHHVDQA